MENSTSRSFKGILDYMRYKQSIQIFRMTTAQTIADSKRVRVSSYEISSGAIGVTIVAAAVAAAGMAGGANPTMNGAGTGLDP